jgi:hypothetical protein
MKRGSNQLAGDLKDEDLQKAMNVVNSNNLVGLMTEIDATMGRCERFFRWTFRVNPTNQEKCRDALLHGGSNSNSANKKTNLNLAVKIGNYLLGKINTICNSMNILSRCSRNKSNL